MQSFRDIHGYVCPECGCDDFYEDEEYIDAWTVIRCVDCGNVIFDGTKEELFDAKRCPNCGSINYYEDTDICDDCGYGEDFDDVYVGDIPEGCAACGGPYPNCIDSCKLMSD